MTSSDKPSIVIRAISADETRTLRRLVLRAGMENQTVVFEGDDDLDTVHLGAFDQNGVEVGVSTWLHRSFAPEPDRPALQLRGMATAVELQSRGIGAALLSAGLQHAQNVGVELIWANARDAALGFYSRHGYTTVGEGFIETVTRLPHHRVVKYLAQ